MSKSLKSLIISFVSVWLVSCSSSPGPVSTVAQKPTPQTPPQAVSTQGIPVAEVRETEFNFGAIDEGGEYIHDFKVANKGNGDLEIKKVLPA